MSHDLDTIISTLRSEADPELAGLFYEFEDYYEQKLWHQLTERLDTFYQDERSAPLRLRVYDTFVSKFQDKINQLKLTNFLLLSLKGSNDTQEALDYLGDLQKTFKEMDEKKQRNDGLKSHYNGILLIDVEIARIYLTQGDLVKARDSLDSIEQTLEVQDSLPLQVTSAFYSTSAQYYQAKKDFNNFYYTS